MNLNVRTITIVKNTSNMKPVLAFDLCVFTKPSVPCYLLLGAVLLSLQLKPLNAGENEVRALAKLFPTNMISVQRLQVGIRPKT